MGWFGKKKEQEQPEPQGPDFVGALRSVVGFVRLGQRGYLALQGLPRFRVTEEELIEWVRFALAYLSPPTNTSNLVTVQIKQRS